MSQVEQTADPKEKAAKTNVRVSQSSGVAIIGFWGWLFTIGYLHLTFWNGVLALILWPYDLGSTLAAPH